MEKENLEKRLFPYRDKKITCIGDSFTYGTAPFVESTIHDKVPVPKVKTYVSRMEKWLGTIPKNTGVGGASIAKGNDQRAFIGDQVKDVKDQDVITILGGTNDFASARPLGTIKDPVDKVTTFYGALKYMITTLAKQNPHCKFLLMTPTKANYSNDHASWKFYDDNGNVRKNKLNLSLTDYVNAIVSVGEYYSIPVLNLFKDGNYNPYLFPDLSLDGLHPNDEGNERLAKTIAFKINSL